MVLQRAEHGVPSSSRGPRHPLGAKLSHSGYAGLCCDVEFNAHIARQRHWSDFVQRACHCSVAVHRDRAGGHNQHPTTRSNGLVALSGRRHDLDCGVEMLRFLLLRHYGVLDTAVGPQPPRCSHKAFGCPELVSCVGANRASPFLAASFPVAAAATAPSGQRIMPCLRI